MISLKNFKLVSNYVLIKPDPDYEFLETKSGRIWIPRVENIKDEAGNMIPGNKQRHVAITGTVLVLPEELIYKGDIMKSAREGKIYLNRYERASMMSDGMDYKTTIRLQLKDKVYFGRQHQMACLDKGLVFEVSGYGKCMAMPYSAIYGFKNRCAKCNDVVPINGNVFFKRDEIETEGQTDQGVYFIRQEQGHEVTYGSPFGTVVASDWPILEYSHDELQDPRVKLKKGDRIAIRKGHGHRIAYDLHAGDMMGVEIINRSSVLALA